ncbi:hypothetical protein [Streptomyces solicavernae]|uniref:hypothetical protein n=1 Tax=Streptomyces solicavernae TaxID=3043614 RepID=UPI0032B73ED5
MSEPWPVDVEQDVLDWLDRLTDDEYLHVEAHVGRLLDAPTTLGEPYSRHLGDGLRELRFISDMMAWQCASRTGWLRISGSCC